VDTKTEQRLQAILTAAAGWLPSEQLAEMHSLVLAGEPGIASENFCTQLEKYDVVLPSDIAVELTVLAARMGIVLSPRIISRR
jgi:hypothetical protein